MNLLASALARRSALLPVLVLVAAGALLRAWPIADWPLEYNEILTWRTAVQAEPWELLTWEHHREHPPLSYALVKLDSALFGTDSEWALRLPFTVAGALCIPIAHLLGSIARGRVAGLLFASLVAFDPLLVAQARQARMYPLLAFFFLATLSWFAILIRRREDRLAPWLLPGLGLTAAFWSQALLGLIVWLGVLAGVLVERRSLPIRRGAALAFAVALAGSAVGLSGLWHPTADAMRFSASLGKGPFGPAQFVLGRVIDIYPSVLYPSVLGSLLVLAGFTGLVLLYRRSRGLSVALVAIAVLSLLSAVGAARPRPFGIDRYLVLLRVALHGGLAFLVAAIPYRSLRTAACAGVLILAAGFGFAALPRGLPADLATGSVIRTLREDHFAEGDAVAYYPRYLAWQGEYSGLPVLITLGPLVRAVPADHPYARTWVVLGHGRALPTDLPGASEEISPYVHRIPAMLAAHYGVRYDSRIVEERLASEGSLAVGLSREGVEYVGPGRRIDTR
jgi:4-amino-4-deoxy-L-arabinose transferase-like glycosyltransferase